MHFTAYGLGSVISLSVRPDLAQLASAVCVLVFQLVGGAKPTIPQMKELTPPLYWASCVSYMRYAQEALYIIELRHFDNIYDISTSLSIFGYELNDLTMCICLIPVFGVVFRLLTLFMLYQINDDSFLNRAKQVVFDTDGHWTRFKKVMNYLKEKLKKLKREKRHTTLVDEEETSEYTRF